MADKLVKPVDDVTVYATDKAKFVNAGEPMVVHSVQADKLVASGKATRTAPTKKDTKDQTKP
jgi:hypothetical protein